MKRRTVLVINPEEQIGLFDAPAASSATPQKGKRSVAKKRSKKRSKKKGTPTSKRAAQCRRTAAAPSTVECEPMKRNKAGQFKPSGGRRQQKKRRRRRNPEVNPSRRRRRRRNPEGGISSRLGLGGMMTALRETMGNVVPMMGAKLAIAFAVKRWGTTWGEGLMGDKPSTSPYGGQAWSLRNYLIAIGVGAVGSMIVSRWKPGAGRVWMQSVADDIVGRLVWTEVIARSKTGQDYFGFDPVPVGWEDDGQGNRFAIYDGTNYRQAMLGLEQASALGGLERAGPMSSSRAMGHLTGPRPDPYLQLASPDPDAAAVMRQGSI